ncbi:sialate:O-sulfotransferase 2-like [Ptychodera flava]|uniref:sialate:O-sulfotransferase 2-like n=1 Tax=Ptychodera flava TaxID=63121 RepID=UPI00396A1B0F
MYHTSSLIGYCQFQKSKLPNSITFHTSLWLCPMFISSLPVTYDLSHCIMKSRGLKKYAPYLLLIIFSLLYVIHYQSKSSPFIKAIFGGRQHHRIPETEITQTSTQRKIQCHDGVTWPKKPKPVVGLLGPPGSGLLWLRAIIEQLTGCYSGSVYQDHQKQFKGEGKKDEVLTVMSHNANQLPEMQGGIVLYRNLKDCVQTEYINKQYNSNNNNISIDEYHANYDVARWTEFAHHNINEWEEMYRLYFETKIPVLLIKYENLLNPEKLNFELERIASYLGSHPMHYLIDCIVLNAENFKFRPVKLNSHFDPFTMLSKVEKLKITKYEKYIEGLADGIYVRDDPAPVGQNQVLQ